METTFASIAKNLSLMVSLAGIDNHQHYKLRRTMRCLYSSCDAFLNCKFFTDIVLYGIFKLLCIFIV